MGKLIGVVGAGFSGAVIARGLAEASHAVEVFDERPHAGGNCHTERDARTGVMVHKYGPHIFHTSSETVWRYICRFGEMVPFRHRVIANSQDRMYSLPINLLTLNQFFGRTWSPAEARAHLDSVRRRDIAEPANFEEQALHMVGEELYRAFFRGYTMKQWGRDPTELPASILKRLPMRLDYEDSYFSHRYQAIPREGYTALINRILDHPGISLHLSRRFEDASQAFDHVVYSGPIDRYFNYSLGRLEYRTLDFETLHAEGDAQGAAVVNFCDAEIPWTRITEHKHFAPWESDSHGESVLYREYSRRCEPLDVPYYPIRLVQEEEMLKRYVELANTTTGATFVGRLGTYRYIDMDVCIAEALRASEVLSERLAASAPPPAFVHSPL